MASSDDEVEAVVHLVTNYHFVDNKDEPISFSVLPIRWSNGESSGAMKKHIFLHGFADSGLQKIYKQVTAWKLELSYDEPKVSVLSKEKNWIKLQKPRKSFEDTIRTILITIHFLHFVRKNLCTSEKSPWDHLRRVFSLYEVRPENILLDHLPFISAAVKHDEKLAKSKLILSFLGNHKKRKAFDEDMQNELVAKKTKFIFEDDDEDSDEETVATNGDGSDEMTDRCEDVCSICDNGGELLCCNGTCFRSFHATLDDGSDSYCRSLDLSKAQVKAIQKFVCLNCQHKQHQCFACGKLGSSDKSLNAEVFPCAFASCGHFYHPECVAKLLHLGNEDEEEQLKQKIAAGESFSCPVHKCLICKEVENTKVRELQFAICRRCPRAYHRKCLPRKIAFDNLVDVGILQRAWDNLLPKRILIYCLKHKIEKNIGTPIRNHIIFPNVGKKKKAHSSDLQPSQGKVVEKMRNVVFEDSTKRIPVNKPKQKAHPSDFLSSLGNVVKNMRNVVSEDTPQRIPLKTPEQIEKVSSAVKDGDFTKRYVKQVSGCGFDSSKKSRKTVASRVLLKDRTKSISMKKGKFSTVDKSKEPLKEDKSNSALNKSSELVQCQQQGILRDKFCSLPLVDADTEKRLEALMKEKAASITLEEMKKTLKVPSACEYSKNILDKAIKLGKVEDYVEKLKGCSIEDANIVCEPEILYQITKWKIVEKLRWYVQNGDMIVDICCGASDFSCLMKQRLEEIGKKCSFKNYDVVQPTKDINFEKKNWMTVHRKDLPTGSQLIMWLYPPFGVKPDVVNKFIDKALEFKPKLLILVVPKETERFDEKEAAYDLVWEDGEKLSYKSFFLPGSIDVNEKQIEEWNLKPPLLYLWSRSDWTANHKAIALKCGHISKEQKISNTEEYHDEPEESTEPMEDENHNDQVDSAEPKEEEPEDSDKLMEEDHNHRIDIVDQINDLPKENNKAEEPVEIVPEHNAAVKKNGHEDNDNREDHNKDCEDKVTWSRGNTEAATEGRDDHGRLPQVSEVQRMNLSAMQQNVSRLKELNHARNTSDMQGSQSSSCRDLLGFALAPIRPFSQQNSSCGWLDE